MINKKFNYAIILLSKTIFVHEDNPVETMFTTMLMDKTISYTNTLVGGRIPKTDAETLAVLSEEAIIFYIAYIDKLKLLFTNAHHQNKMTNGKGITWKEICDKKDCGILTGSFLNFCKDYCLIPHMFNVEALQEILLSIIPPLQKEEYEYFNQQKIVTQYEKEKSLISTNYEFVVGEPQLLFHEFMFALGKIAYTTVTASDADTLSEKLKVLFIEKLHFPEISDPNEYVEKYLMGTLEQEGELYSSEEELEEEYEDDPHQLLLDFIERRAEKDENFVLDYKKVLNDLDVILPQIPDKPKVEVVNPPPYSIPRVLFGKRLPKPEEEGKDKKKKPQPKKKPVKSKKDEKPKKIYPFAEYPPKPEEPSNKVHVDDYANAMEESIFPIHYRASH